MWRISVSKKKGNKENPQHQSLLSAEGSGERTHPGWGPDGVLRDVWGNPYIMSFDMNYDNQTRDAFYRSQTCVREMPRREGDWRSYFWGNPAVPNSMEARGPVMIWSLGPDGAA